mgnify:CR=1 FL=1
MTTPKSLTQTLSTILDQAKDDALPALRKTEDSVVTVVLDSGATLRATYRNRHWAEGDPDKVTLTVGEDTMELNQEQIDALSAFL